MKCSAGPSRTLWLVALVALVLPALFMAPTLLLGRPLVRDDAAQFVYPQFHAYAQCLKSNHLYLWDPAQWCGLPALATGQSMGLYPPHLLLFRLLPWQLAVDLGYWLHLALAFAGFVLVAHRLGLSATAAVPGALLYTYSGYQAAHLVHYNFVAGVAHLPLMVWLLDRALVKSRGRDWGWLALEAAVAFLVMHPQVFVISAFTCLLWLVLGGWRRGVGEETWRSRLPGLLAAGVIFLLLIMPQLLPTAELAQLNRQEAQAGRMSTEGFAGSYGYGELDLIRLILPNLFGAVDTSVIGSGPQFHETCAYVGIAGLLVALAGLVLGRGRRGWWLCIAAVVLGAVLMWSGNPVYALTAKLPFVSSFRAMGRWAFMPIFGVGLLVAMAAQSLPEATRERRLAALKLVGLVAALLLLSLLALWVTFGAEGGALTLPGHPDRAIAVANMAAAIYNWLVGWEPLVLLAGMTLAIIGLAGRMTPRLRALIVTLAIGLPLWHFWQLTNRPGPSDYYTQPPQTVQVIDDLWPPHLNAGNSLNRITTLAPELVRPDGWPERRQLDPVYGWRELLTPALGTVFGLNYAEGYKQGLVTPWTLRMWSEYIRYGTQASTGVIDTTAETIERVGTATERMKRFHRLCGAQFLVTPGRITDPDLNLVRDGPVRVYQDFNAPWIRLVGKTIVIPDAEQQLQAIKLRSFNPETEAVVDREVPGLTGQVNGHASTIGLMLPIETDSTTPALLVVSQAWYPGWRAFVDGRPAPLLRANYAFRAVPVPAGEHEVTFTFASQPFRLGLVLCGLGLVALIALVCRGSQDGDEGPRVQVGRAECAAHQKLSKN